MQLQSWTFQVQIRLARCRSLLLAVGAALLLVGPVALASAAKSEKPEAVTFYKEKRCRWTEHESRLTSFTTKIRSLEKEISDLISYKKTLENAERVRLVTQQISFKHSDLSKVIREYEDERLHVRFQHPDRDREEERQYQAVRLKSLSEIEEAFGLDGRLDRLRQKVKIVYPTTASEPDSQVRAPASTLDDEDKPEQIRLVK